MKLKPILALGALLGAAASVFWWPAEASRGSTGTYSLPAGNPVTTHSTISSTWANNTLADVGTELTNSLDRQGRGAMLAPLQLPNGSSSAPSLTWASELNTGLYRAGSQDVRMQVNSTALEKWAATGVTFPLTVTATGLVTANGGITSNGTTTLPSQTTIGAPTYTALGGSTGWTFSGGINYARYFKDATGLVHVEAVGAFATGGGANPFNSNLPAGFRPFGILPLIGVRSASGGVISVGTPFSLAINTDGSFSVAGMTNTDSFFLNATFYGAQ